MMEVVEDSMLLPTEEGEIIESVVEELGSMDERESQVEFSVEVFESVMTEQSMIEELPSVVTQEAGMTKELPMMTEETVIEKFPAVMTQVSIHKGEEPVDFVVSVEDVSELSSEESLDAVGHDVLPLHVVESVEESVMSVMVEQLVVSAVLETVVLGVTEGTGEEGGVGELLRLKQLP